MAAATALLWGLLPIALKVAVGWVAVLTIVWVRFALAWLVLAGMVGRRDRRRLAVLRRPPVLALAAGLMLLANYILFLAAVDRTSPSNAQVLIQLAPLLLAILGVIVFRERLSATRLVGATVAVIGLVLFQRDQIAGLLSDPGRHLDGDLMLLGAAVSWALYAVFTKVLARRGMRPQDLNLVLYAVPVVALPLFVDWGRLASLTPGPWILLVALGLNTLLAYGAMGEALARLPAHEVSLVITLNPVITLTAMAVLSALQVGWIEPDRVGAMGFLAAAMVLGGVVAALRRP